MLDIHTVGAGGGSIGWRDPGGALRVGPRSAGARPGPACYGHGGTEPTVTDANLVLGLLAPGASLGGEIELDRDAAADGRRRRWPTRSASSAQECAEGIRRVANAEMVRALRVMTVERGRRPARAGAAGLRRRRRAARRRHRRRARDDADPVPARLRRARRARPGRLRAPPRRAAQRPARRRRAHRRGARARSRTRWPSGPASSSATRRPTSASPPSCATAARRSSWRCEAEGDADGCARRSTPPTRSATASATPRARSSSSPCGRPPPSPAPTSTPRRGRRRRGRRALDPDGDLRRRGARGDRAAPASRSRARRSRARRWSSCPRPRSWSRPAGPARCWSPATIRLERS